MQTALWIDGRLTTGPATIAADDHAVLVGDGAFETLVVVDGPPRQAFAVTRHLARLRRSCLALGLDIPFADTAIREAIDATVTASGGAGVVRLVVTSGSGPLGSSRGSGPGSVIVVAGGEPPHHLDGTAVVRFPHPRNERGALAGVKTTSYAENVVALRYAHQRGASEAIFGDTLGRLCEGTGSNVFWSDGETLFTPPLETGCLAGITRELIAERVPVTEAHLDLSSFAEVDEAFLASTTRGVQSIGTVDEAALRVVGGPLTKAAALAIDDLMATDHDP